MRGSINIIEEHHSALTRTNRIVKRLVRMAPMPCTTVAPYPSRESVAGWWAAQDRFEATKREFERLHKIIYPRIQAKVRARYGRTK